MVGRLRDWAGRHPHGTLILLTLAALVPFLGKPFNMDDPLFLWSAKQIAAHPFDPYGFNVDWGWTQFPMCKVTENPPLTCYYLALAGTLFGWGETVLHAAFLVPAIAVVLGTYRLAKHLCSNPLLAAGLVLCAPVFLVSATSVMCDVMALAGWVWAASFWLEGATENSRSKLLAAGVIIALATLTKYFAVSLLPLLVAYCLARRQPLTAWGPPVIVVFSALVGYQWWSEAMYHQNLLYGAANYVMFSQKLFGFTRLQNGLMALGFLGGCAALVVFSAPAWMKRREMIYAAAVLAVLMVIASGDSSLWKKYVALQETALDPAKMQLGFWAASGVLVLWLALGDLLRRRDAESLMLALWVTGVFWFTAFCNWTVNGRSVLPLIPAVTILMVRRLQTMNAPAKRLLFGCVAASAAFTWFIARSDFQKAVAVRELVRQVEQQFQPSKQTVWFQGHWGFQYYLQLAGARPVDFKSPALKPGDWMVVPTDNTNLRLLDPNRAELIGTCRIQGPTRFTTLNESLGAGYYASVFGPLPFVFGTIPPEAVAVYRLK